MNTNTQTKTLQQMHDLDSGQVIHTEILSKGVHAHPELFKAGSVWVKFGNSYSIVLDAKDAVDLATNINKSVGHNPEQELAAAKEEIKNLKAQLETTNRCWEISLQSKNS